MPRVIVSSGHTAANPGSIANGLREADVARSIAKAALKYLRLNGIISLAIPPGMELMQRIEWINKSGYNRNTNDIAIEVHINDGGKTGLEIWYEGEGNNPSQRLADTLLDSVASETGLAKQGSRSEFQHELGSISFLHEILPIACLIECGYIDNANDAAFLKDANNIEKVGRGIAKAVLTYYGLEYRELQPSGTPATVATAAAAPTAVPPMTTPVSVSNVTNPSTPGVVTSSPAAPQIQATSTAAVPEPSGQPTQTYNANTTTNFSGSSYRSSYGGGYGGNYGGYNQQAGGSAFAPIPSREERKELIKKNYVKILGREPNQNDLNYFLNIGIREEELIRKMVDSQEHVDLVKARQEVIKIKQQLTEQQTELQQLRALSKDQTRVINNLNASIQQKNSAIGQLQGKINGMLQRFSEKYSGRVVKKSASGYKGNFLDRLFKTFSDLF
ncbi:MAG TPA: N-acetylmuramoyl-L-alanine amidase, partial [Candidatus Dojkabacteria bacterium]|nr:N-acetylmuramoyl-L-alanine amidase [Candidatus Dojkabacteria bacterium]